MKEMLIDRSIEKNIEKRLFKGKIIVVYGARQVGKTTLAKKLLKKYSSEKSYFNCEILLVRQALEKGDPGLIRKFLGDERLIVLDEAQKIKNIGQVLKLLIDTYPDMQIVATGSSSFDLADKVSEPLTGRALEFVLYPFSLKELAGFYTPFEIEAQLENFLVYGTYPEIIKHGHADAQVLLDNLSSKYLYKDILIFDRLKKSELLIKLLQLLALQIGQEFSIQELAINLQCNRDTVINYLDILEKSFVIFRLRAYSRNPRKEISKKQKIYFFDLGIRNSLISRYNDLALRDDVGALWENFCVAERIKRNQAAEFSCQKYFWRSLQQREIDYVEEYGNSLDGYEFKWTSQKFTPPIDFMRYPKASAKLVNRANYAEFLLS